VFKPTDGVLPQDVDRAHRRWRVQRGPYSLWSDRFNKKTKPVVVEEGDKKKAADEKAKADAEKAGRRLWVRAAQQSKLPNMLIPSNQMIPSLNGMFDAAQSREIILRQKVPDLIVYMLFIAVFATCFIGGFTSGAFHPKEWIIVVGFSIVTAMVVYTTIDLSRPLRGMIQDDAGKNAIVELRKMF